MIDENEIYPDISFHISSKIARDRNGWGWNIRLHIEGPDDVHNTRSGLFISKRAATEDLLVNVSRVISEMLRDAGK